MNATDYGMDLSQERPANPYETSETLQETTPQVIVPQQKREHGAGKAPTYATLLGIVALYGAAHYNGFFTQTDPTRLHPPVEVRELSADPALAAYHAKRFVDDMHFPQFVTTFASAARSCDALDLVHQEALRESHSYVFEAGSPGILTTWADDNADSWLLPFSGDNAPKYLSRNSDIGNSLRDYCHAIDPWQRKVEHRTQQR
jgi:hypothetical protein